MANWAEFIRSADGGKVLVNLDQIDRIEPTPPKEGVSERGVVLWQGGEALYVNADYDYVINLAKGETTEPKKCPSCGKPEG